MEALQVSVVGALGCESVEVELGVHPDKVMASLERLLQLAEDSGPGQLEVLAGLKLHVGALALGVRSDGGLALRHDWVW